MERKEYPNELDQDQASQTHYFPNYVAGGQGYRASVIDGRKVLVPVDMTINSKIDNTAKTEQKLENDLQLAQLKKYLVDVDQLIETPSSIYFQVDKKVEEITRMIQADPKQKHRLAQFEKTLNIVVVNIIALTISDDQREEAEQNLQEFFGDENVRTIISQVQLAHPNDFASVLSYWGLKLFMGAIEAQLKEVYIAARERKTMECLSLQNDLSEANCLDINSVAEEVRNIYRNWGLSLYEDIWRQELKITLDTIATKIKEYSQY